MKDIFVLGSVNFDLTVHTDRMPQKGETACGKDFITNSGGKGANQAVAAAKLGGNVKLIGAIGNDFLGKECLASLTKFGVDATYVQHVGTNTGTATIIIENGDNRIIIDHGANFALDKDVVLRAIRDNVKSGDIFVTQLEIPTEIVEEGLSLAKQCGAITVLNPAPAVDVTDKMLANADYVIPNETEAQAICGLLPCDLQDLQKVDIMLHERGANNVLVTLGSNGCYYNGKIYPVANKVVAVDTTAAGDTFVGALAVCLAEGKEVANSIDFCQMASSLTVTRYGAQISIPYLEELDKIV